VALLALVAGLASPLAASATAVVLDRAHAVRSDADRYPDDARGASVALPDEWGEAGDTPTWYRLRFDAPGAVGLQALYIERVCSAYQIQLNGEPIHSGGRLVEPLTRNCYYPQLVELPAALLHPHGNVLDIKVAGLPLQRVAARQRAGGLSAVVFGPHGELAARHERRTWWNVTLPMFIGAAMLVLGLLMLAMGWLDDRLSHLTFFGLLAVGWAALSARQWLRDMPLGSAVVEWLVCATVPLAAACAVLFLLRYAGLVHRAIDVALLAQCAMVPASLAIAGPDRLFMLSNAWWALLALEVVLASWVYLWFAWRAHRKEFWVMLVLLSAVALTVALEFASQHRWLVVPPRLLALHYVLPAAFIAIGLRMMQVHARALGAAEAGRSMLERRLNEITTEVERHYSQLADMRVEQVTERERKRIAADLHDDLGAKLLTIVHTSDNDRISTLAREALEEMRLSVRGLTGKPVRLADALGDWRAEVMARLGQAGISAEWTNPAEEPTQTLSARAYVQTTRILREATSNIIKHSGASRCTFHGAVKRGDFVLTIQDNGNGIPLELDGKLDRGHGMASMKHRAKQLQGQCLVESGPGYGTVIRLTLPL
jgi:signal transduction histidine kinase